MGKAAVVCPIRASSGTRGDFSPFAPRFSTSGQDVDPERVFESNGVIGARIPGGARPLRPDFIVGNPGSIGTRLKTEPMV